MIYLDYSATTPVNEEVINTYSRVCREFIGNPNSLHKLGIEAKKIIDASTMQIANILGVKQNEIIYTSGASEANNLAIKGVTSKYKNRGKHIITTELEHSSIIAPLNYLQEEGYDIDFVKLDDNGLVDLDDLENLIRDDTVLVSIASVILVDLSSISCQKFFGMKGIGALIKRENLVIEPIIHGGKSTTIYRSGTPATPLIVSFAKALRLTYDNFKEKENHVKEIHDYLISKLQNLDVYINSNNYSINNIVNFSLKNIKSEVMLHALEEKDIYISTQTACSTRAVYAVCHDKERASRSMRVSISYLTTRDEIDEFIKELETEIKKLDFRR